MRSTTSPTIWTMTNGFRIGFALYDGLGDSGRRSLGKLVRPIPQKRSTLDGAQVAQFRPGQVDQDRHMCSGWRNCTVGAGRPRAVRVPKAARATGTRAGADAGRNRPAWLEERITNDNGTILTILANALIALRGAPELKNVLAYDQMLCAPVITAALPGEELGDVRPVTDVNVGLVQERLQHAGRASGSARTSCTRPVDASAPTSAAFHPVRRASRSSSTWDGTAAAVANWLRTYVGAKNPRPTSTAIGEMFLVSMVARIFKPGLQGRPHARARGPAGH